jgi:hypothetical protein
MNKLRYLKNCQHCVNTVLYDVNAENCDECGQKDFDVFWICPNCSAHIDDGHNDCLMCGLQINVNKNGEFTIIQEGDIFSLDDEFPERNEYRKIIYTCPNCKKNPSPGENLLVYRTYCCGHYFCEFCQGEMRINSGVLGGNCPFCDSAIQTISYFLPYCKIECLNSSSDFQRKYYCQSCNKLKKEVLFVEREYFRCKPCIDNE